MDGLSTAASGLAVVSLAIQLVDSVRETRRFLRLVSEAPKELSRLLDLLEQLELILENIGMLIEKQQRYNGDLNSSVSASVQRALKTCESKIKMVEDVVDATKKASSSKNKAVRSFGSLRLACKKRDIEEFERQLQHAVTLLDLAMTMNLTAVHSQSRDEIIQVSTNINSQVTLLRQEIVTSSTSSQYCGRTKLGTKARVSRQTPSSRLSKVQSAVVRRYRTPFGTIHSRWQSKRVQAQRIEDSSCESVLSEDEHSLTFVPSFLSHCIQFQYLNSLGFISGSFRITPVIPSDHPAFQMCKTGDIHGLQTYFSSGSFSPFSVDSDGWTLLHASAMVSRFDVCKLLFQLGLDAEATNRYGDIPSRHLSLTPSREGFQSHISTCRLFASYFGDMADACPYVFWNYYALDALELYINEWVTEQNVNEYHVSPLHALVRSTHLADGCYRGDYSDWKRLIRRVVRLGANIHETAYGRTILESLMSEIRHPFDSKYWGDIFLEALSEAGVDVLEYLKKEVVLYNRMYFLPTHQGMRRLCIISLEEPLGVSWDWWTDPEGPAFDVLEEFKYFSSPKVYIWWHGKYLGRGYASDWPSCFPYWDYCMEKVKFGLGGREELRVSKVFSERFAHHQKSKAAKLARAQGLYFKGPRVPGAWVD